MNAQYEYYHCINSSTDQEIVRSMMRHYDAGADIHDIVEKLKKDLGFSPLSKTSPDILKRLTNTDFSQDEVVLVENGKAKWRIKLANIFDFIR